MRAGQRVGKYVLGEPIARGGMAEVWAARVEGPGGFVKSLALKFILESFTGDAELERLFFNEARVAARLSHANIVAVFDFDKVSDPEQGGMVRHYIAMERVEGHDLRRVLQAARHKRMAVAPGIALHVTGEVLKGLRYVHEFRDPAATSPLGLVHRDVSPHNVLVGLGGEVKLSDFGIAKARAQSLGTQTGMVRGKLAYASPEQLRGEAVDHRADQFALGIALWEMLAARRLFGSADEQEIIGKVLSGDIPPLPTEAGVDAAVESLVRRMLAPAARDRFGSTAEALSAVLAAPGYLADAKPLVELMSTLYPARPIALPPTLPLNLPAPEAPRPLAETSDLGPSPAATRAEEPPEKHPGAPGLSADPSLVAAWWAYSDSGASAAGETSPEGAHGRGKSPRASGKPRKPTVAAPAADPSPRPSEAITARVEPDDVGTGSAYVSAEAPAMSRWTDRASGPPARGRRLLVAAVGVAAAAGVAALVVQPGRDSVSPPASPPEMAPPAPPTGTTASPSSGTTGPPPSETAQPQLETAPWPQGSASSPTGVAPPPTRPAQSPSETAPSVPGPGANLGPESPSILESGPAPSPESSPGSPGLAPVAPPSGPNSFPAQATAVPPSPVPSDQDAVPPTTPTVGGIRGGPTSVPARPPAKGKGIPANGAPILE